MEKKKTINFSLAHIENKKKSNPFVTTSLYNAWYDIFIIQQSKITIIINLLILFIIFQLIAISIFIHKG